MARNNDKAQAGGLYYLAKETLRRAVPEDEAERQDITKTFFRELECMIRELELININVGGRPRIGKSTLAMALAQWVFGRMQALGMIPKERQFGIRNIARDDQEWLEMMRDADRKNDVLVTDEYNALESTGPNATTEMAMRETISDVQGARYVHRISCTPREIVDPNADILLTVMARNKAKGETICRVDYRLIEGATERRLCIGHIKVSVAGVISQWNKIKDRFYKGQRSEADKEAIIDACEKDWYCHYVAKKHEKINIMMKEGITRPRMMGYAGVVLDAVRHIEPLARMGYASENMISNFIKKGFRERKIPASIIGETLATKEAKGIADAWRAYNTAEKMVASMEKKGIRGEIMERWKDAMKAASDSIISQKKELALYETLAKKYARERPMTAGDL